MIGSSDVVVKGCPDRFRPLPKGLISGLFHIDTLTLSKTPALQIPNEGNSITINQGRYLYASSVSCGAKLRASAFTTSVTTGVHIPGPQGHAVR